MIKRLLTYATYGQNKKIIPANGQWKQALN